MGVTDADVAVARRAAPIRKPVVIVAANKVDDDRAEADAAALWSLGLGEPTPVSALHGGAAATCSTRSSTRCPRRRRRRRAEVGPRRVALLGRPNVGKSSLLNKLVGDERSVVDAVAGTTIDPVDELVELGGDTWRFVDTAGIRRRVQGERARSTTRALRTASALEAAEVAIVLVDAERAARRSRTCASSAWSSRPAGPWSSRYNKWDLVDEERRTTWSARSTASCTRARWAPRVNISAATGRPVDRLVPALRTALVAGRPGCRPGGSTPG